MSAKFVAASSQHLANSSSPVTAVPITVGCWFKYNATGAGKTFWSIADTAVATNFWYVGIQTDETILMGARDAGVAQSFVTGAVPPAGTWCFVVARMISATSRRLALLKPTGTEHLSDTNPVTPASVDTFAIGARVTSTQINHHDGNIAEFWYTNTDIQPDGAQLNDDLLRTLAYRGPFAVPHIKKDIIEYRSFRQHLVSANDQLGEVYWGASGRQTWTNTNGATVADHPPLTPGYYGPADRIATMLV